MRRVQAIRTSPGRKRLASDRRDPRSCRWTASTRRGSSVGVGTGAGWPAVAVSVHDRPEITQIVVTNMRGCRFMGLPKETHLGRNAQLESYSTVGAKSQYLYAGTDHAIAGDGARTAECA